MLSALALGMVAIATLVFLRHRQQENVMQRRYEGMFNNAMVGIGIVSPEKRWLTANPTFCTLLGYTEHELQEKTWLDITHPDDRSVSLDEFAAVQNGRSESYIFEKRYLRKDQTAVDVSVAVRAVRKNDGSVEFLVAIVEDISARKQATRQLDYLARRAELLLDLPAQSESMSEMAFMQHAVERMKTLTESTTGFIKLMDDGAASTASPLAEETTKGTPHHVIVSVLEVGKVRMLMGVGGRVDRYAEIDNKTIQLVANETWRLIQRMRNRRALEIASQVINASPVVSFRWAACDGWPVVFVSENVRQWGYDAGEMVEGRPVFADIVHPDDLTRIVSEVAANTARGDVEYEQEYRLITADNRVIWVVDRTIVSRDENGQAQFYDGVLTDITDRKTQELRLQGALAQQQKLNKRLEHANNQLLQSEKMASIGQLAAGVAHELNNPIGFVHSNLGTLDGYLNDLMTLIDAFQKLEAEVPDDNAQKALINRLKSDLDLDYIREDIFNLVSESKEGLSRVKKIVQDLKSFSRVGEQEWQPANLHQGLDSTLNIVWNELKYKCKVIKDYGDIPNIFCLISQLNQVFMNLLVNAGHAIEKQGEIRIRTAMSGENQVLVEICDTGSGIPKENLNRIFEPFFTTKPVGKGTGLGLSLAYSIIQRHHGKIEVDSEAGKGTCFRITLPVDQSGEAKSATASGNDGNPS